MTDELFIWLLGKKRGGGGGGGQTGKQMIETTATDVRPNEIAVAIPAPEATAEEETA